jgi:pimeloyl-ACP methyl ester carboxylesterase
VLIPGFGTGADIWNAVAPALSGQTRVCSYDRFGTGTSDAPPADQTFASEAADLHDLLRISGETGPYVVVGHSFGGAEAVELTSRYADEVEGLLLLDASPTDWPAAVCAVPDDGSQGAAVYRATCTALSSPSQNPERLDVATAFSQVGAISTLGAVPLVVETRADLTQPGLAPAIDEQLADVWRAGQDHWASLSSASRMVRVAQTSHNIQVDQPQAVIDQVVTLLPPPAA